MTLPEEIKLRHPDKLYIGGQWDAPTGGPRLDLVSPHREEVTASVAGAGFEDIDRAVRTARQAFDAGPWPALSPRERAGYLGRLREELDKRFEELKRALVLQTGTLAGGAEMLTGLALHMLDFYAGGAGGFRFVEEVPPSDGQGVALVAHEPVGVVAAIAPWNAPLSIMMNKIAPALLAGCPVIMKPAPETPLEAFILAEAAEAAGFPPGVVNLAPAGREVSDHLVSHPGVDKVSFTGSTAAGKRIASVCGQRVARCTLELGGKSAAIILDDYDIREAARMLANVIVIGCGQVCVTLSRVIVSRHRQAELCAALKEELEKVRVGDPDDPASGMGPLAMARQLERVLDYVQVGIEEGATLVCGGDRPAEPQRGYYINPTVFADVSSDMRIAREEIFGPVLCILPCEDEDDAVRIANDSDYGLYGAVLTHDNDKAYRMARRVRTGSFAHNGFRLDYFLPFGGVKQSGLGREGGIAGLKSYLESKTILLDGLPDDLDA